MVMAGPNATQLSQIASLISSSKAMVDLDKVFPFAQTVAAVEYF